MALTLVVQRGHVPRTRGATGGPHEQQIARAVAELIPPLMPAGWSARIIDADEPTSRYAGDAFVSLHCDAAASPLVRGASVGYRTAEGGTLGAAWKAAYATCGWRWTFRHDNYTAALAGYYGTGQAAAAGNRRAVIIEQGFTTNPTERAWLLSPEGQQASARAVVWAVTGIDPHTTPTVVPDGDLTIEEFMATLTPDQQNFLRRAAEQGVREQVDGQSFVRQMMIMHRDERPAVQELIRHLDSVGSTVQGLVRGGVGFIRRARQELGWKLDTE